MKINRKLVNRIEGLAHYYRHRTTNRAKDRQDLHLSQAQHPSRTRSHDRQSTTMEARNNR